MTISKGSFDLSFFARDAILTNTRAAAHYDLHLPLIGINLTQRLETSGTYLTRSGYVLDRFIIAQGVNSMDKKEQ
jgi:hypothetical protein